MRYLLLATDYDGTLALHGRVDEPTLAALERLRETGRKIILVTGRELPELLEIFPEIHLFDLVVAENGALLYVPPPRKNASARTASSRFRTLIKRGVEPLRGPLSPPGSRMKPLCSRSFAIWTGDAGHLQQGCSDGSASAKQGHWLEAALGAELSAHAWSSAMPKTITPFTMRPRRRCR